jgi:hypothetical protein
MSYAKLLNEYLNNSQVESLNQDYTSNDKNTNIGDFNKKK